MNRDLYVNEVVFLAEEHQWNTGEANPLTCFGRVVNIRGDHLTVEWGNGHRNTYGGDANDLVPVVYETRDAARTAALRNRNTFVYRRTDGYHTLMIRRSLAINDNRQVL